MFLSSLEGGTTGRMRWPSRACPLASLRRSWRGTDGGNDRRCGAVIRIVGLSGRHMLPLPCRHSFDHHISADNRGAGGMCVVSNSGGCSIRINIHSSAGGGSGSRLSAVGGIHRPISGGGSGQGCDDECGRRCGVVVRTGSRCQARPPMDMLASEGAQPSGTVVVGSF